MKISASSFSASLSRLVPAKLGIYLPRAAGLKIIFSPSAAWGFSQFPGSWSASVFVCLVRRQFDCTLTCGVAGQERLGCCRSVSTRVRRCAQRLRPAASPSSLGTLCLFHWFPCAQNILNQIPRTQMRMFSQCITTCQLHVYECFHHWHIMCASGGDWHE